MATIRGDSVPTLVRTAQVVGITGAAFASGAVAWLSYSVVPTVKLAPEDLAPKLWKNEYETGKATMPFIALASGLSFSYLMTQHGKHLGMLTESTFYLNSAAAILVPAIVPFTILAMRSTNNKLMAKAEGFATAKVTSDEDESVTELVGKWRWLNAIRALMLGAGAVSGMLAVLNE